MQGNQTFLCILNIGRVCCFTVCLTPLRRAVFQRSSVSASFALHLAYWDQQRCISRSDDPASCYASSPDSKLNSGPYPAALTSYDSPNPNITPVFTPHSLRLQESARICKRLQLNLWGIRGILRNKCDLNHIRGMSFVTYSNSAGTREAGTALL